MSNTSTYRPKSAILFQTTLILLASLFASFSFGQSLFTGKIVDSETGQPLPYAYVLKKGTNRGTVTNEDGSFKLMCLSTDTLTITFIGYDSKEVVARFFAGDSPCKVKPSLNELETFNVSSDYSYLLDVLTRARKKLLKSTPTQSRTYFTLETSSKTKPTELIECYYNGTLTSGISGLDLKSGRIGMSARNGAYFVSLNTTDIISNYNLLSPYKNEFPNNPLHYGKASLKKLYKYELVGLEDGIYKIEFTPKKAGSEFEQATIWLDRDQEIVLQIDLRQERLKKHPFAEISKSHSLDSLNFGISYTFKNQPTPQLEKIEFNYNFNYNNLQAKDKLFTQGLFLFYDYEKLFDLPRYAAGNELLSDYDKIVSLPHNTDFWANNQVLIPSKKMLQYRAFFDQNGVLLNFDNLVDKVEDDVFEHKLVAWNGTRIFPYQINKEDDYALALSQKKDYHTKVVPSDLYELSAQIFLDYNVVDGQNTYVCKTLVNLDKSFFYLERNNYSTCFINIYFDLVEVERRNMLKVLNLKNWNRAEIDSIYRNTQAQLEQTLRTYRKRAEYGNNKDVMRQYIATIKSQLQIDNSVLVLKEDVRKFFDEDKLPEAATSQNALIDMYNYGSALLKLGRHEESLEVLNKAVELGYDDAWLMYNVGYNYMKLGKTGHACAFFQKSAEMGEELSEEIKQLCAPTAAK